MKIWGDEMNERRQQQQCQSSKYLLMRVVAHRCNSWLWLIGVIVCRLICQFVVIEAVYILTDESIGVVSASYMDYYR